MLAEHVPATSPSKRLASRPISSARFVAAAAAGLALASVAAPAAAQNVEPIPIPLTGLPRPTAPELPPISQLVPGTLDQQDGLIGTRSYDRGLYVHYCPTGSASGARAVVSASGARAFASHTSWAGWPAKECLKMDKGSAGSSHVLVGLNGVHNWLLGGYGNDTIIGGDHGDVIWGDYHPSGEKLQVATIRAGNGRNVIYANDTRDFVWTGTNPGTVVHAHGSGTSGVIHCESPGIVVYLSTVSQRHFKLDGCRHISHFSVGY
jgi:hypothetical protein